MPADATPTVWTAGHDDSLGVFVLGIKMTIENGATRPILGSHLWSDDIEPDSSSLAIAYAEIDVGEAAFMLASTYHGGSANNTTDQNRLLYAMFMCKGTLRQDFATLLEYPPEAARGFSKEVQATLGYNINSPNRGMVDTRNSRFLLEDFGPEASAKC